MAVRGRPPFKPTPAQRQRVEQLVFAGMTQEQIASVLSISVETLVKHFAQELDFGLAKKRAEVVAMLFKAAKGGNVTAQKKLEEMGRTAGAEAEFTKPRAEPRVGKKAQAEEEAKTAGAGTGWGDDLSPPVARLN